MIPIWPPESAIDFMDSQQIATGMLSLTAPSVVRWSKSQRSAYDIYASAQDRDLGGTAAAIQNVAQEMRDKLGPADSIVVRGQATFQISTFEHGKDRQRDSCLGFPRIRR